jgi:acyl-homoserine-lactone acylase
MFASSRHRIGISLLAAALPLWCAAPSAPHGEILWDSFGVPHVFAANETGVFYGFGWAQAQSHGDVILHLYGEARGRAAEYWGESWAESDRWVVSNGIYERAAEWYKQQTPQFRADLDAFAAGMNAFGAAHPDRLSADAKMVLPISGVDVMAHAHRLMNYIYIASSAKVLGTGPANAGGSNAWAVGPSKSASGHAMLLANPHLPWAPSYFTYYEAQLEAPGIHMYGATQVGLPVLRFCFNDQLAFTNTVNVVAGFTAYALTLTENGYRFDNRVLPFEVSERKIRIRQKDGSLKDESVTIRRTVHGPVFKRQDGTVVALRVAGLDRPGVLKEYWDMALARNFAEFESALKAMQVPMFNIVYADRQGHILYQFTGIVPRHKDGDLAYWSKPVPGDTSGTMWNDIHPYEDLPRVLDPASGFVQNANDTPWGTTYPIALDPKKFAPYMSSLAPMSLRAQQSVHLLISKPKLDFTDFQRLKLTTRSLLADRILPELLDAAARSDSPEVKSAIEILKAWDHNYETDSRGALLFETWASKLMGPTFVDNSRFATPWSLADPIETPRGLKDPAGAVKLLQEAFLEAQQKYGAADKALGGISRFHLGGVSVPGNGGFGNTGIFRTITWSALKDGERTPVHGETWVSMVEFSTPLKAVGLMSYGNSTQPGSKHRGDQLEYLSRKELRTLWRTRAEVEKHLEEKHAY